MTNVNNKYREFCFDREHVIAFVATRSISDAVFELCALERADIVDSTYNDYVEWKTQWKEIYKHLSQTINQLKNDHIVDVDDQSVKHKTLNDFRRLANTMLNARQYVEDVRRAVRDEVKA